MKSGGWRTDISETDLTARVPVHGKDDIAALAVTFNTMLDRLETAYRTQRAFVDDASHELRTPITVIRGHLELMEDNAVDRQRTLALVDDELARMGRIVSDLLLLAKVDRPGFIQLRRRETATLLLDIEAKAQVLGDRGWPILEIAEGPVSWTPQRITQAVLQLATNACQYSAGRLRGQPGLPVRRRRQRTPLHRLGCRPGQGRRRRRGRPHLRPVPPGHAAHQTDRARPGAGLGLAIVRSIAEAHHGTAWLRSTQGEGATFGISIPAPDGTGVTEDQETRHNNEEQAACARS